MPPVSVPFRAARAAVFAAVATALSAGGHALMSGDPLPWWAPLAGFGALFALAFAGAGRERSFPAMALAMAGGQAALHTFFAWSSALRMAQADGTADTLRVVDRLLCGHGDAHGHVVLPEGWSADRIIAAAGLNPATAGSGDHMHGHTARAMLLHGGIGMVAAHLVAALAAAWWLRRGEGALFAALAAFRDAVAVPLRAAVATLAALLGGPARMAEALTGPGARRRDAAGTPCPAGALLRHAVTRRGPPAPLRVPAACAAC